MAGSNHWWKVWAWAFFLSFAPTERSSLVFPPFPRIPLLGNLSQTLLLGLGVSLPLFVSTCRGSGTHWFQDSDPCGSRSMWLLPHVPTQPVPQTSAMGDPGGPFASHYRCFSPDLQGRRGVSDASAQLILGLWIMNKGAPKPQLNPQHALSWRAFCPKSMSPLLPPRKKKLVYCACTSLCVNVFTLIDLLTQIPQTVGKIVHFVNKHILV